MIESSKQEIPNPNKDILHSVKNYTDNKDLKFSKVDIAFMNKYETF